MDCQFSEFSYAYSVTEGLKKTGLCDREPPEFLSTIREGKTGGGWDMRIGVVFLQFKRPVAAIGSRSKPCGDLERPFYRIYLRQREEWLQHKLLLELEGVTPQRLVRYCAPRFWEQSAFESAYEANQILEQSVFIRPSWGPLPTDEDPHHFAYGATESSPSYFCSEPSQLRGSIGGATFLKELRASGSEDVAKVTAGDLMNQLEAIESRVQRSLEKSRGQRTFGPEEEGPEILSPREFDKRDVTRVKRATETDVNPATAIEKIRDAAAIQFNAEVLFR